MTSNLASCLNQLKSRFRVRTIKGRRAQQHIAELVNSLIVNDEKYKKQD